MSVKVAIGILLSGCATKPDRFVTFADGVCEAFPRPPYVIKGKTAYDQKWADKTTEAGVAGCDWDRPKPRPASLDPKPIVKAKATPAPAVKSDDKPKAKPGWRLWNRRVGS